MARASLAAIVGLDVGSEVDYCIRDDFWTTARVEAVEGSKIRVRCTVAAADVSRVVDVDQGGHTVLAPAGTYTIANYHT